MTYSWTYATAVYIDNTNVTDALLSYSLSGNQTSTIVSGEIVFSKRALDAILTPVTNMSVIISRIYQVTEDGVTTTTDITIFRGH
ncbi:MAG TPA: hypothetical protein PLJ11_07800, partial [Methanomassiliicoccales archaeon]|nr:hypothetical protein [Methanomassiliicoccales archaeon]